MRNNTMQRGLILSIVVLMFPVLAAGCRDAVQTISFEQLFSAPDKYSGKQITIEGFYFHGWEAILLSEDLGYSGYASGHLAPVGRSMWVEGGIPGEVYDRLYEQRMMGPTERFGKVKVTGKFEYGGKYGHLGSYDCQIALSQVELLDWSPKG